MKKWNMLAGMAGLLSLCLGSVSVASVPKHVTDDTAIYQRLSDIRVQRDREISFDNDIARLSSLEGRYRERLPNLSKHSRLSSPMKRISERKYSASRRLSGKNPARHAVRQ